MMKKLKIGIIGCGMISDYHIRGYKKIAEKAEIVALCDIDKATARKRAKEWNISQWFTDYRDLLKIKEIDVVDIMVPHNEHIHILKHACEKKKNIIIEKPLCISPEETYRIQDVVYKTNARIMVANNLLFHPAVEALNRIIKTGRPGIISHFEAHSFGWFIYQTSHNFRLKLNSSGGGALLDTGIHFVYLLRHLIGEIQTVCSFNGRILNKLHDFTPEGDDTSVTVMQLTNNILGTMTISYSSKLPRWKEGFPQGWDQGISIYGSCGSIRANLTQNEVLLFSDNSNKWENFYNKSEGAEHIPPGIAHTISYEREINHFIDCILSGSDFRKEVTVESASRDIAVVNAIYRSNLEQKMIEVE